MGKRIVRNAIRGISVLMIVYAFCLSVVTAVHLLRPVSLDTSLNSITAFKTFPDYCFELMILGSSDGWCGINPVKLEAEYGVTSFNYCLAWQHLNTSRLFLKDLLQTQKPKVVILETDSITNGLLENANMNGEIWYTRPVGKMRDKVAYLSQCFGSRWGNYVSYALPVLAFHDNWKEVGEESFMENANDKDFISLRGFMSHKDHTEVQVDLTKPASETLGDRQLAELDSLHTICLQNDIQLVLCTLPKVNRSPYEDALREYSVLNRIPYYSCYDNYEEIGLLPEEDFYDGEHLNTTGANKVTDQLVIFLKDAGVI